jgi:hypothetical protein
MLIMIINIKPRFLRYDEEINFPSEGKSIHFEKNWPKDKYDWGYMYLVNHYNSLMFKYAQIPLSDLGQTMQDFK